MGMSLGRARCTVADPNIVPLIDILLVLLVIFMVIPHSQGLRVQVPQQCSAPGQGDCSVRDKPTAVVIQVLADGSLRVNQEPVNWGNLESRLTEIYKLRADRTAFIQGDAVVEFAVVARAIDVMRAAGIASVGLLTQQLGNGL